MEETGLCIGSEATWKLLHFTIILHAWNRSSDTRDKTCLIPVADQQLSRMSSLVSAHLTGTKPGFDPPHFKDGVWWCTCVIPTTQWKQGLKDAHKMTVTIRDLREIADSLLYFWRRGPHSPGRSWYVCSLRWLCTPDSLPSHPCSYTCVHHTQVFLHAEDWSQGTLHARQSFCQ